MTEPEKTTTVLLHSAPAIKRRGFKKHGQLGPREKAGGKTPASQESGRGVGLRVFLGGTKTERTRTK